jgi:ABC-type transport system substrate-binding protein
MPLRLRVLALLLVLASIVAGGTGSAAGRTQDATPVSGGTLNLVAEHPTLTLNPYDSGHFSGQSLLEGAPVIEGAFHQAPDGTWQPQLVTSVDIATGPFTLTYHIDPAAKWSDGQPVTADDFVFTWQTLTAPANVAFVAGTTAGFDKIASMTALDPKTVQAVFSSPVAFWREMFSSVLPEHALQGEDFQTAWTNGIVDPHNGHPIGDGPFLMSSSSSTLVTYTRNANWWGPHAPYLNSIVFHVITSQSDEVNALLDGQVQAIYPAFTTAISADLASLRTTSGIATQSSPVPFFEHIDFNVSGTGGPLEDQTWVRQAIADAIDRPAIVNFLFGSLFPTLPVGQSGIYFPSEAGYAADFATYAYSVSQVTSLMNAHSCTMGGDNIWICGGQRMSFRLAYPSPNGTRDTETSMIHAEAGSAGIEIVPTPVSSNTFFSDTGPLVTHDFDLALFAWAQTGDPSDWDTVYECGGSANYPQYCNVAVDNAFAAVDTETDTTQRIADANQADALLAQDVPVLPLWSRPDFLDYSTKVRGLVDNPNFDGPLWNAQDIWLAPSVAAPVVTSFSPSHGTTGTSVTITGSGLTGATAVTFGGTAAQSYTVDTDTQITATVAAGTPTGTVSVTGPGGSATTSALFFTPPTISSFTPGSAGAHATITVTGASFTGATAVKLDGASVPFTVTSNTRLTFTFSTGATSGTIAVTGPAGTGTSAGTLTVLPPPAISGISPGTGPVGTPVTITGTGLAGTVGVRIGSLITVPTSVSSTSVTFTIPPGAVSGVVQVLTTTGSATSADTFTVTS